jgi:DNA-directed RNA polymerase subunit beta'
VRIITTPGRAIFNEALPAAFPFVNEAVTKKGAGDIINQVSDAFPRWQVIDVLDAMKDIGYRNATRAGVTVAISRRRDAGAQGRGAQQLGGARREDREKQFSRGVITDSERRQELIEIWTEATTKVADAMETNFSTVNPFFMMGQLRCPREHDPAAADRRHAWARGQPEG